MPKGILTRFIVRKHQLVFENIYWKNGVVLEWEGVRAKITSPPFKRKIQVAIRGDQGDKLLWDREFFEDDSLDDESVL